MPIPPSLELPDVKSFPARGAETGRGTQSFQEDLGVSGNTFRVPGPRQPAPSLRQWTQLNFLPAASLRSAAERRDLLFSLSAQVGQEAMGCAYSSPREEPAPGRSVQPKCIQTEWGTPRGPEQSCEHSRGCFSSPGA